MSKKLPEQRALDWVRRAKLPKEAPINYEGGKILWQDHCPVTMNAVLKGEKGIYTDADVGATKLCGRDSEVVQILIDAFDYDPPSIKNRPTRAALLKRYGMEENHDDLGGR